MKPTFDLFTIRFSHYNEKARWALDRFQVPYLEHPSMPVLHFFPTIWVTLGRGQADPHSTRFSTPILKTDRGELICDSGSIVKYVSERLSNPQNTLFPTPEAAELDKHFSDFLAPHTRCFGYFNILPNRELMSYLTDRNVPAIQATVFKTLLPLCRNLVVKKLKITSDRSSRAKEFILKEFEGIEKRLQDGRRYLLGDHFSAADIAFASLSGPALLIQPEEGYAGAFPPVTMASPEAAHLARHLRETSAGRFVLRLFREERGERQVPCEPRL